MKSKKNSLNAVFFILIVMVILVVFLAILQRQENKVRKMEQREVELEQRQCDLVWDVLIQWVRVDSLMSVISKKDSQIVRLEEQKATLQSEILRLQPYELKSYECLVELTNSLTEKNQLKEELSELRDSISRSKVFEVAIPDSIISVWRAENIRVFPTVFENHLLVTANIDLKARLSNIAGYLVKQFDIPKGDKMRINTSDIKSGVYFISFYASYEGQEILLKTERIMKR